MRPCCSIIPDDMLERIARSSDDPGARYAARRTLEATRLLRQRRLEATTGPVEPNRGEDRKVYDAQGREQLPGTLVRKEDDPPADDEDVDRAYDGAGAMYALLLERFLRRSIDGEGMAIVSTVHYGLRYSNAFWDSTQMVYGDGDGRYFYPFTRSVDVIGHELQHGVTQYTADLRYQDQSGALNEHVSDVFGALLRQMYLGLDPQDPEAWLIGAELFRPGVQARGLRDMLNPGTAYDDPTLGKDPQPAHMDDYYQGSDDNGGVHINSGICNRAFATFARAVGVPIAGAVWYAALRKAGARTEFQGFAALTAEAAQTHGGEAELGPAWDLVGIDVAAPVPTPAPDPGSPCLEDLRVLLEDPAARGALVTLGAHPVVRRLLAQARRLANPIVGG